MRKKWIGTLVNGGRMEKLDLPFFYELGSQLRPLTEKEVNPGTRMDIMLVAWEVEWTVGALLESFSGLSVCRTSGEELLSGIKSLTNWFTSAKPADRQGDNPSVDYKFRMVISKAKKFETVLSEELKLLAAYHVSQIGAYSIPILVDRAEEMLPISVLRNINSDVRDEIRGSGRCFAFGLPTASAFHIMRATEAVMYDFYLAACKPEPKPTQRLESWGAYIAEFRQAGQPYVKQVAELLQTIKDLNRNPIMHPEVVLNDDEAFELFELAKGAIIIMAGKSLSVEEHGTAKKGNTKAES